MISKEIYEEMKKLIAEHEAILKPTLEPQPYFKVITLKTKLIYNPDFGDDKDCKCGHSYYRHFDTYEEMATVGCKYCECFYFEEANPTT